MGQKNFETADLYLTSAISILLKKQPEFRVKDNRILFAFPVSDDLYEAMNQFNNGIPLNAFEFSLTIKRIRAEMLIRKGAIPK